jgi:predicted RNase H-like HicB family nuclease
MAKKAADFIVTDGTLVLRLEPADEGGYVVTSPFNPDILTQAETLEEAFENARDVITLFEADRKAERSRKKKRTRDEPPRVRGSPSGARL